MGEKTDLVPEIYDHLWDLFENTHDLVQSVRPDGSFLYVNRAWREALGYSTQEIANLSLWSVIHEQSRDLYAELTRRLLAGENLRHIETVFVAKTGQAILVEGTNRCRFENGRPISSWGIFRDITQRKKAKEALCASENRLRAIIEAEPACVKLIGPDGTLLEMNPAGLAMIDAHSLEEAQARPLIEFVLPEYREAFLDLHARIMRGERGALEFETLGLRGTRRWLETEAVPLGDASGKVIALLGITRDVTARRAAEERLKASEAFLRMTQQAGQCGGWEWEPATGRVKWSDETYRIHGVTPGQFQGTMEHALTFIHPDDLDRVEGEMRAFMEAGTHRSTEFRIVRPSGETRIAWVRAERSMDAAGLVRAYGTVTDVTSRRRAEEESRKLETQLRQAQKLESLGVLAGGIAHDFNNLLTSVLGYATLAGEALPADSPARPMLKEIERAAERAAELTGQMLAYSGRGRFFLQPFQLDALVREMSSLLRTVVSKKAEVALDLEPAPMEGDVTQIRQIVMNLITNASDALENRTGRLSIRTGVRAMTAAALASTYLGHDLPDGAYAFLEVADTGHGMSGDVLGKIFDPFFTTKTAGRGLGLAAALGIVRGHGGTLRVSSTPGQGTRFQVYFPASTAKIAADPPAEAAESFAENQGTILVVDDEENVRAFVQKTLERAGFQVLTAADGLDGLDVFIKHRQSIHAVVLDLTMPRLDGWEVAARLSDLGSDVPILLISGYSQPELSPDAGRLGIASFLRKPFRPADLIARVSQMVKAR